MPKKPSWFSRLWSALGHLNLVQWLAVGALTLVTWAVASTAIRRFWVDMGAATQVALFAGLALLLMLLAAELVLWVCRTFLPGAALSEPDRKPAIRVKRLEVGHDLFLQVQNTGGTDAFAADIVIEAADEFYNVQPGTTYPGYWDRADGPSVTINPDASHRLHIGRVLRAVNGTPLEVEFYYFDPPTRSRQSLKQTVLRMGDSSRPLRARLRLGIRISSGKGIEGGSFASEFSLDTGGLDVVPGAPGWQDLAM